MINIFIAAFLGSLCGLCVASIWAYRFNRKWMEDHKDD